MLVSIIDAVQHNVFKSDEISWRMLKVAITGRQKLGQRMLAVKRHQFIAQCIVGRMQRHRQRNRAVRSEEHTSELQSLMRISYAVFCLKKKTNNNERTLEHNNNSIRVIIPSSKS